MRRTRSTTHDDLPARRLKMLLLRPEWCRDRLKPPGQLHREGMTVDFTMSDGFSAVTYLVSNHEVKWR